MNLQEIDLVIERCSPHVTDKESDFLTSARAYFLKNGCLTPGQLNWVASIASRYSPQKLEQERLWKESWSKQHRDLAIKVANYYHANPPYFSNYVERVLSDPEGFILTKKEWDKFCENKYAKKILNEYSSDPKFVVGQTIQIRANNKVRKANYDRVLGRIANKVGFVLQVNAKPITRAAKGSRVYKVLLAGEASPIFCHESDIKKKRGSK